MTNKLDEHNQRTRFIKICVAVVVLGVLIIGGLSIFKSIRIEMIKNDAKSQLDDSRAVLWLNSFLSHNYEQCDIIAYDNLVEPNWTNYMDSYTEISNVISGLVDCIENVTITNKDLNVYTVEVTYTPYKKVSEISVDKAYLTKLGERYANNDLYSSELQTELDEIYVNAFKDTVFAKDSESEKTTISLTLSENDVNGVTLVYGTKTFVETLLSDTNILNNLQFYEKNIKSTVEQYLVTENQM